MSIKVAVLGNTGMLGHMVQNILSKQQLLEVRGFGRDSLELYPRTLNQTGTVLSSLLGYDTDWVINCMGATKPYFNDCGDMSIPIYANGLFPHQLAQWANLMPHDTKVVHITTDCVYDGNLGKYDEEDVHCPNDDYGKSKSMGEPSNCMVLRTSIIGPELTGRSRHFLSWVKSLHGSDKQSQGFTNHLWNGLTTLELAYAIANIVCGNLYEADLFHLFSSDVSKFEMVKVIGEVYGLSIDIVEHEAPALVDRRLRTIKGLNDIVGIRPFRQMLEELKEFEENEHCPF
jgi:dTDP-4-dehydrorhamnose reductase